MRYTPSRSLYSCLLTAVLLLSSTIQANEKLKLSGIASFTSFNHEIYVASLWLEKTASSTSEIMSLTGPKRMELHITSEKWRQRNFAKTWSRAIIINNDENFQQSFGKEINAFSHILKGPLLYGDKIDITLIPNKQVSVTLNGTTLFTTKKVAFFDGVLNAWTGKKPPSSHFKESITQLDTGKPETNDAISRLETIAPSNPAKRSKEIKTWVTATKQKKSKKIAVKEKKPVKSKPATIKAAVTPTKPIITPAPTPTPTIAPKAIKEVKKEPIPVKAITTAPLKSEEKPASNDNKKAKTAPKELTTSATIPPTAASQAAPQVQTLPTVAPVVIDHHQQLANDIETAKATLNLNEDTHLKNTDNETHAAEANFDDLISQLESEQDKSEQAEEAVEVK